MAGLACAATVARHGFAVEVFDKGRRPGGRITTRRTPFGQFDHGAQYFTANDPQFRAWTEQGLAAGTLGRWDGALAAVTGGRVQPTRGGGECWVGVPGMSAVAAYLAAGLAIRPEVRIAELVRDGETWQLYGHDGALLGTASIVIIAVPAPQAVDLLRASPRLAGRAAEAVMLPCWAAMLGYAMPLPLPFDGAFINDGPLSWICRNSSKPGRAGDEALVVHASPEWSRDHLEDDALAVCEALQGAFAAATGIARPAPVFMAAHRWRYARVAKALETPCLFDDALRIGACGDWCLGANIEAAFRSGQAMAETLLVRWGAMAAGHKSRQD